MYSVDPCGSLEMRGDAVAECLGDAEMGYMLMSGLQAGNTWRRVAWEIKKKEYQELSHGKEDIYKL